MRTEAIFVVLLIVICIQMPQIECIYHGGYVGILYGLKGLTKGNLDFCTKVNY